MDDREKLIALLVEAESLCAAIDCFDGAVCEYAGEINGCAAFRADHLIANGAVVRDKGEWVMRGGKRYCPVCKARACVTRDSGDFWYTVGTNFCPDCGADMRGAVNDG